MLAYLKNYIPLNQSLTKSSFLSNNQDCRIIYTHILPRVPLALNITLLTSLLKGSDIPPVGKFNDQSAGLDVEIFG